MLRTAAGAIAVLMAALAAPEAHAGCCGCAWSASRSAARTVITSVNARIDRMESSIVETLELQTAQLSGYIAEGAKSITDSLDAQMKLQAEIARDEAETQSKLQHRPTSSGCRTVTGMAGLAEGRAAGAEAGKRAGTRETGRIGGDSAVVGDGAGMAADTRRRFGVWTGEHCSESRLEAGADVCRGDPSRHDADIRAGSLFDVDTFGDDDERLAAGELGRNLAAPLVWDRYPLRAVDTDQDRELAMLARAADARSALASDWFARSRGAREPAVDLAGWASTLAPGLSGDGTFLSRHELLEVLASRRFENPAWAVGLQSMNRDNLLRELALLQAASLMLDWERYRMDERRGAMEAARLGAVAEEMRRLPGLADWLEVQR